LRNDHPVTETRGAGGLFRYIGFMSAAGVAGATVKDSIRSALTANDRICFVWREGGAEQVEIVDYH
jgi:hypothetical protein